MVRSRYDESISRGGQIGKCGAYVKRSWLVDMVAGPLRVTIASAVDGGSVQPGRI
jgi:hypothetical protein